MSTDDRDDLLSISELRQELKQWEKTFITVNDGRKPGRDDIKKNAAIAAKYKEYDRLRRPAKEFQSSKPKTSRRHNEDKVLQEVSANAHSTTPKRTPSKRKPLSSSASILSPVQEIEATPAFIRCALGPTPQKDGQVLGIFDVLSAGTPSRQRKVPQQPTLEEAIVPGTPSKTTALSNPMLSRTPQSSGTRLLLDASAGTPLKRKREGEEDCPNTDKRKYATPSFLRRSFPMSTIDEDIEQPEVYAPPFKKRGLVRSLSSIIQGLRKQEEQRMEDEWDILNVIEEEERNPGNIKSRPQVVLEDNQTVEMPLGPDHIQDSGDEISNAEGQETSKKPWKKKGLKRQTRRVIMRPVLHQPGKATDTTIVEESGDEMSEVMPAAERDSNKQADAPADEGDRASKHDVDGIINKERAPKKTSSTPKTMTGNEENIISKGVRKISAQAHANFRKLKIKNKNSKANGRGRFGRR